MRPRRLFQSYEQWRQTMLDDTSRFIEWGLQNPERVEWIPNHPVGKGQFSERAKGIFWSLILHNTELPD